MNFCIIYVTLLQAPEGCKVRARFEGPFGIFCASAVDRGPACYHWVEIKYKKDKQLRGGRYVFYLSTRQNGPKCIEVLNSQERSTHSL